jgi:hypothetical protein
MAKYLTNMNLKGNIINSSQGNVLFRHNEVLPKKITEEFTNVEVNDVLQIKLSDYGIPASEFDTDLRRQVFLTEYGIPVDGEPDKVINDYVFNFNTDETLLYDISDTLEITDNDGGEISLKTDELVGEILFSKRGLLNIEETLELQNFIATYENYTSGDTSRGMEVAISFDGGNYQTITGNLLDQVTIQNEIDDNLDIPLDNLLGIDHSGTLNNTGTKIELSGTELTGIFETDEYSLNDITKINVIYDTTNAIYNIPAGCSIKCYPVIDDIHLRYSTYTNQLERYFVDQITFTLDDDHFECDANQTE